MSSCCKKGGKENTDGSQRLADVPSAKTEFVVLQLLVYLVESKDSVPG